MSHWIELQLFEKATTFCFRELAIGKDQWKQNDWRQEAICRGRPKEGSSVRDDHHARHGQTVGVQEKAYAWSFVEFRITAQGPSSRTLFAADLEEGQGHGEGPAKGSRLVDRCSSGRGRVRKHALKTYAP
jgi:hypothetical protein